VRRIAVRLPVEAVTASDATPRATLATDTVAGRFARFALRTGRALPPWFALWFGGVLGDAFGALPMRDQRRAREHLARAFPRRDATWIRRTARAAFRHTGRMALWTVATNQRSAAVLRRDMPIEGRAWLARSRAACARGEGVVGVTGHFGNWELLGRLGGSVLPLSSIGKPMRDAGIDAVVRELRTRGTNRLIPQGAPVMASLRELRQGRMLATLPDQDVPRLASVFVPWFGIAAATPSGPGMLAAMARVPVQPAFCYLRAGRWVMHWGPRTRAPAGLDRDDAALWLTAWTTAYQEALVRRAPEQWVWWHKRWRTRPPGEQPAQTPRSPPATT